MIKNLKQATIYIGIHLHHWQTIWNFDIRNAIQQATWRSTMWRVVIKEIWLKKNFFFCLLLSSGESVWCLLNFRFKYTNQFSIEIVFYNTHNPGRTAHTASIQSFLPKSFTFVLTCTSWANEREVFSSSCSWTSSGTCGFAVLDCCNVPRLSWNWRASVFHCTVTYTPACKVKPPTPGMYF